MVEVRCRVECFNPGRRCFESRQPLAYYLVTCEASVETAAIRGHWDIENCLHHVLDASLGEDPGGIRKNPGIFAQLRHYALNLLRHNGKTNIRAAI